MVRDVGGAELGKPIFLTWVGSLLLRKSTELSVREGRDWGAILFT